MRYELLVSSEEEAETTGAVIGTVYACICIGCIFFASAAVTLLLLTFKWVCQGLDPALLSLSLAIGGIGLMPLILGQAISRLFLGCWFGQKMFIRFL